jgi:hypothetical protein
MFSTGGIFLLQICYPLLDRLLECVDVTGNDRAATCSDLLGLVEVTLCQENHLLQVSKWGSGYNDE